MKALIGYTGFVGSNLVRQTQFDKLYNSKNIHNIHGEQFDLLICSGVSAVKWKANQNPQEDLASIQSLMDNLKKVKSKRFVLISTVDVYRTQAHVNEDTPIDSDLLEPYGKHRYYLEQFIQSHFENTHIVRLPGLFGEGLKKNIIYDLIHNNHLEAIHSQNIFQFYNLERLNRDIETVISNELPIVNFATEPVSVEEVAQYGFDREFTNQLDKAPVHYDMQSKHAGLFNGNTQDYYLMSKQEQLSQIKAFVQKHAMESHLL